MAYFYGYFKNMLLLFVIIIALYLSVTLFFYNKVKGPASGKLFTSTVTFLKYADAAISAIIIISIFVIYIKIIDNHDYILYTYFFYFFSFLILLFIPKAVFSLVFFTGWIFLYLLNRIFKKDFGNKALVISGLLAFSATFIIFLYGIIYGKTNLKTEEVYIYDKQVPEKFDGMRIIHISDLHLGSFNNNTGLIQETVKRINELRPDIVCFTGDLVNNFAAEAEIFDKILSGIKSKSGNFAVLGNHDFGDYTVWKTESTRQTNLNSILKHYKKMGFTLLRNESTVIAIENDSIVIAGVDNWGLPPFKQYGDIYKSLSTAPANTFTIILSHDPSYWDNVIKHIPGADITLSGHTHAMQFGIDCCGIFWSPVKYRYPQWAGFYKFAENCLYVNRGIGFIGFTGRIGMTPEITCITLKKDG